MSELLTTKKVKQWEQEEKLYEQDEEVIEEQSGDDRLLRVDPFDDIEKLAEQDALEAKYSTGKVGEITPWVRIRKHKELYITGWGRETIVKIDVIVRTSQDVPMPNNIMALNVCRSFINSKPTRCE